MLTPVIEVHSRPLHQRLARTNMSHVKRDETWVLREYGDEKWPAVLEQIRAAKASGEKDLSRALFDVIRLQRDLPGWQERACVLGGEERVLPFGVAWEARQGITCETLLDCVRPDTSLVVEMGSGWGFNLLQLWCKGGPRHARYVAAEFTAAGRQCTDELAMLAPQLKLTTAALDYHDVLATEIEKTDGHALVFSCQSLEQIPHVKPDVVQFIASLGSKVTCVHVEPIGWQMGDGGEFAELRRAYAEKHDYNRNLWELLQAQQAEGAITIRRAVPDFVGVNPENPVSAIEWQAG
jgi:hypothetical protein